MPEKYGIAADIAFEVNEAVGTIMVSAHITIQSLLNNNKGNLNGLMETAAINIMVLPIYGELFLWLARKCE